MSAKVKNLVPYLITLKSLRPKQRKLLLTACTKEQLQAFEEIALNLVKNTPNLTADQLRICRRFKGPLKRLASRTGSPKSKRQVLVQKGGFWPVLIPLIASVVGGLISR